MAYEHIGITLLALHLLADFPLQTSWMAANKRGGGAAHLAHIWVHLTLSAVVLVFLYDPHAGLIAMFVAGCHGVIDWRRWPAPEGGIENFYIWVDQSYHVASIALAVALFA